MNKTILTLTATGFFFLILACPQNMAEATAGRIVGCGLCGIACFLLAYIMDGITQGGVFLHGKEEQ